MAYLVTGGSGYVGRRIIKKIIGRGEEAINIDKEDPAEKIEGEKLIRCDLTDVDDAQKAIKSLDAKEEHTVIHLAGLFEKDIKMRNTWKPRDFISLNTTTTETLVDEINRQKLNVKLFVFSSAALVNCLGKIDDIYGKSKLMAEQHIKNNPPSGNVSILRISRVIGGLDNGKISKDIVSDFIKKLISEEKIVMKGSNIERDYVHIDDVCNIILFSRKGHGVDLKNVYSSEQMSVGKIIKMLHEALLNRGLIKKKKKLILQEDTENPLPRIEGEGDFRDKLRYKSSADAVRKTIEEYMDAMESGVPFS